jgi:hypothetical protein
MNSLKVEKSDKTENMNDLKIFLLCISSGAIGFGLIGILPYEIPLFLRVLIAFLFLGTPLLDSKKIVLFGIAGGLGFFIKDYILWDLFSFKWTTAYGNPVIYISLLTGIIIGTLLSIVLWKRKAIEIFPLTGAIAFSSALLSGSFILDFNPIEPDLITGLVFGVGMCLYLLSIKKTPSPLRNILLIFGILYLSIFGFFMIIGHIASMGHPPYVGNTVVSIGEVVEKEGTSIAVTNYTFLQNNTGRVLKTGIMIQNPVNVERLRLHLWYRHDEYLGSEITEIPVGHLENIGTNTTIYSLSFENLPERLRTKDFAVVWEVWTSRGIEYVIWQTK